MTSIYHSEIKQIIYDLGHREDFLYSTTEAVDTLFYNYLHSQPNIFFEYESTIKQFATIQIQDFFKNYVMKNVKSGASETWANCVLLATYTCIDEIAKKDECIEMLRATFKEMLYQ